MKKINLCKNCDYFCNDKNIELVTAYNSNNISSIELCKYCHLYSEEREIFSKFLTSLNISGSFTIVVGSEKFNKLLKYIELNDDHIIYDVTNKECQYYIEHKYLSKERN